MMLPKSISPELRAYLADWLAWTERGAPTWAGFGMMMMEVAR